MPCWYRRVLLEHSRDSHWNSRFLQEHSRGCTDTDEYYMSTREVVLVQKSTIGELGRLCWYSRVL